MAQTTSGARACDISSELWERYRSAFGNEEGRRFVAAVAPGRTEIAGNHTDHEGGHVIAGAVNRYVRGLFSPRDDLQVHLMSVGYEPFTIDLADLAPVASEQGSSAALVRGVCACLARHGAKPHGFDGVVESDVPAGSGLSSSAAFELLIARAVGELWGGRDLQAATLARFAQHAEHEWFGKPCGLMDQMAVAEGGLCHMSFADENAPIVKHIDFDFKQLGWTIVLVAVGADHAAHTADYASIPQEMGEVARRLGAPSGRLCEVGESELLHMMPKLRDELGDRAALRALHYFREERLVEARATALANRDMASFLECTSRSGASSAMYLQNVSVAGAHKQPGMLALAAAEELLGGRGAARVHGGGFGGTIQAFVATDEVTEFCRAMDEILGAEGSAVSYDIDHEGARAWQIR